MLEVCGLNKITRESICEGCSYVFMLIAAKYFLMTYILIG